MSKSEQLAKEVSKEIESQGGTLYEIESYELKPYWEMNEVQKKLYNFGFSSSVKELEEFFNDTKEVKKIFEYIFKGIISSGNLEKFNYSIKLIPHDDVKDVLSDIIEVSHSKNVKEETALAMIKYIRDETSDDIFKNIMSGYEASSAASYNYYEVAKYLLSYDKQKKPLNGYDLYDLEDSSKNYFEGFKWLLSQGISYEKSMIGKMLCQDHLPNMYKIATLSSKKNLEDALDFFKSIGITDDQKISHMLSNCEVIKKAVHPYFVDKEYFYKKIMSDSLQEVEFLLDHLNLTRDEKLLNTFHYMSEVERADLLMNYLINQGIEFSGQKVARKLVNHPHAKVVEVIINTMKSANMPIKKPYDEDYAKYAIYEMKQNMADCDSNKLIAKYLDVEDQVSWHACPVYEDL